MCHLRRAGSAKQPDRTKQLSCHCRHSVFAVCPTMLKLQWKFSVLPKLKKDHVIHCHWRNKWDKCPQGERQTGNQLESNLDGFRFCLGAASSEAQYSVMVAKLSGPKTRRWTEWGCFFCRVQDQGDSKKGLCWGLSKFKEVCWRSRPQLC